MEQQIIDWILNNSPTIGAFVSGILLGLLKKAKANKDVIKKQVAEVVKTELDKIVKGDKTE